MADVKQDLDKITARLNDENFLLNKGLSNEVGIHVFNYDPKHELTVRNYIARIKNAPVDGCRIIEYDLYEIFLQILDEKKVLDKVAALEEKKGGAHVMSQLWNIAEPGAFLSKMVYEPHKKGDVIFMTGIGKAYPFIRAHKLLDSMQQYFSDVPIIMFYPGEFNGQNLILFNEFHDGNYYRAFNIL